MTKLPNLTFPLSFPKTCILISGPTASGKTAAAIELARHFQTEIISADSRQCYKELNIGVAKPSQAELAAVPHHFINHLSIRDDITAADFEKFALHKIKEIFTRHDLAVMVGGTGLYINAFVQGMDSIPGIDLKIREQVREGYSLHGMSWLSGEIKKEDPLFYAQGEILNPQRTMRALEVKLQTGTSILEFQKKNSVERDFNIIQVCFDLPREVLYERINNRVDEMIKDGLEAEVRSLLPYRHLNALQTVGYKEFFEYFDGDNNLLQTIEKIKQHSRQYAKRQMTWFRKKPGIQWISPQDLIPYVIDQLGR